MSLVLYSKGFKTLYKEIDFKEIFNNKEQFGIKYGEYAIVGISFGISNFLVYKCFLQIAFFLSSLFNYVYKFKL